MKRLIMITLALCMLAPLTLAWQNQDFSWVPPTENTDGSPLADSDIGSYNIYCDGSLLGTVTNTDGTDEWTSPDGSLSPGTHVCSATTINTDGVEGPESNSANFIVPPSVPGAPSQFTVTLQ